MAIGAGASRPRGTILIYRKLLRGRDAPAPIHAPYVRPFQTNGLETGQGNKIIVLAATAVVLLFYIVVIAEEAEGITLQAGEFGALDG